MALHGQIHWTELMTRDSEKARRFYAETVGWTYMNMPMDGEDYWVCFANGEAVAGIRQIEPHSIDCAPELWMTFIVIDDVDSAVEKAVKLGAMTIVAPQSIPGIGRVALIKDNGEAAVGWIAPA